MGEVCQEILAVDRVDARPLVRPSTVDQSLSSRSLDDHRSLTPATRGLCIWCGLIPRLVSALAQLVTLDDQVVGSCGCNY